MGSWEPRLDVVCHDSFSIPSEAADQDRRNLLPQTLVESPLLFYGESHDWVHERYRGNPCIFRYRVPLRLPPDGKSQVASFRGMLRLWVATKWETVTVDYPKTSNSAPAVAHLSDGHRITVINAGPNADNPVVNANTVFARFDLSRDDLPQADWLVYRHMVAAAKIAIHDGTGQNWTRSDGLGGGDANGLEGAALLTSETNSTVFQTYDRSANGGPPAKVTIEFPIARNQIDVPYDIHHLLIRR